MKFCRYCKYTQRDTKGDMVVHPRCNHKMAAGEPDLVTGESQQRLCEFMRMEWTGNPCGPEAKLFEAQDSRDLPMVGLQEDTRGVR